MKKKNTTVLTMPSVLSLAMLGIMFATIIILAQAPDYTYDPTRAPFSRQHGEKAGPVQDELTQRFDQAIMMLHAKKYENAIAALHRVIQLSPRMPEAYVNMGYALLGLQRYHAAHDFFNTATDLNPYQANAYWGLAVALENSGDLQGALGAMRIFIHLSEPDDPFVRKARAALWEWDMQLKRGPLPEHEKEFLRKGARRWEERTKPERDVAEDPASIKMD
jgi:tetratricopeptide (TPR) repeat protein